VKLDPLGKKGMALLFLAMTALVPEAGLMAWSEHPLISHPVISSMPEVRDAKTVPVESIEAFISAERNRLEKLLSEEEAWAKANLQVYPPLPDSLAFRADGSPDDIRRRFCHAIRVNPTVKFPLYLQLVPGEKSGGMTLLLPGGISFLRDTSDWSTSIFAGLKPGDRVMPLDVAVSATDEPDLLGLDIGLFEDNATAFGKIYGFGRQPFGNPNLEYGSQAPFHMGFYHESAVIYFFAGFLKKRYPEYRIHLYKRLAQLAFESGHPYWGWRFTGWGLHYLADLAQPYHATALPGVSTLRALWISTIDMIGIHGPKAAAVQLVSNRHTALEKFVQVILQRAYQKGETDHPLLAALRSANDAPPYEDTVPRHVIARRANEKAKETDKILEGCMPLKFVSDPDFELGTSGERKQIVEKMQAEKGRTAIDRQTLWVRDLLMPFAAYGKSYVRAILSGDKGLKQ
jgi:hypothetical protein